MATKKCIICQKEKELTEFYVCKVHKDGTNSYRSACKFCYNRNRNPIKQDSKHRYPRKRLTQSQIDGIKQLYLEGERTLRNIGEVIHCCKATVHQYTKDLTRKTPNRLKHHTKPKPKRFILVEKPISKEPKIKKSLYPDYTLKLQETLKNTNKKQIVKIKQKKE